jgi:Arc/MetJ-type ribon-helix-helix transcriptional regulator
MAYSFPPDLGQLVADKMASGVYRSEDDLLRHAMEALNAMEAAHNRLRADIAVGLEQIDQGLAKPLDLEAFKLEARNRLANRQ